MLKVWRRLSMRQKYKKHVPNNMFSLAHFFLRCCHTFFTSALGLLSWTSTLQEWCKSEKFWKFQILIKFKLKLNIIFSEKIWKNQKNLKISEFQKKMKNSWQFKVTILGLVSDLKPREKEVTLNGLVQKKSENFRFSEKCENFRKIKFHKI